MQLEPWRVESKEKQRLGVGRVAKLRANLAGAQRANNRFGILNSWLEFNVVCLLYDLLRLRLALRVKALGTNK